MTVPVEQIVDCDVHVAVPGPAALLPHLSDHWQAYFEESSFRGTPGPALVYPGWSAPLATKGADLTLDAVRADVLSRAGTAVLVAYYGVEAVTHPYLAGALASAVNGWLRSEWLDRDDRLLASAALAPHFAEGAIEEVHRIADDPRFVQVLLPTRSAEPYGSQRYWPIWAAAAERGLALALTPGGSAGTPPTPTGWLGSFAEEYAASPIAFQTHVVSLVVSGIFQRHPDLRVVVMESGWTWLPQLLWRMDLEWKAARRETPWLTAPPSEYVRRHFRFTTQPFDAPADARHHAQMVGQLGSDELLLFGSDYPHDYGGGVDELFEVLTPAQAERVLAGNAAETYRLAERRAHV
jgi:predicted TIM-barrel fold metal-dependent hydrolase